MSYKKIEFESLESLTSKQTAITKWLLLYCMEKVLRQTSDQEDKNRRQEQFNDWKQKLMPNFEYSNDFHALVKQWWDEEYKWYNKYCKIHDSETLINGMVYRILAVFFRNHSRSLYVIQTSKNIKSDNEEFYQENQKLFRRFINRSIKTHSLKELNLFLKAIKNINIHKAIDLASDELHDKFWKFMKGMIIGGTVGVASSLVLGPVIGGWIGNMAGLSGAAATNYGLALLGGGSLASGGFGMTGGSILIGTLFGVSNGLSAGKKSSSISNLDQMQASQLPVFLALGQCMYNTIEDLEIPELIHNTLSQKVKTLESRYKKISRQKDKDDMRKLINLYERATKMSESGDWMLNYDEVA